MKKQMIVFSLVLVLLTLVACGKASDSITSAAVQDEPVEETAAASAITAEATTETTQNAAEETAGSELNVADEFSLWDSDGAITELISYVEAVTDEESADYIPVEDRLAVFDLDGTLVGEQFPIYFEWLMFAQRVLDDPNFEADDEMKETAKEILTAGKEKSIPSDIEEKESELFGKAFAGMTTDEFRSYVSDFLSQNADGFDGMTFGEAYFRPMVQVISYLEEHDFKVYICSGTDREADRVIASGFTDIPMYQIIGSDYYTEGEDHIDTYYLDYQFGSDEEIVRDDTRIIKDVKSSKVVQMSQELGQKPVLAFGNSSGDMSMFTYTTSDNPYKSAAFCLIPDDDEREYAYPEKAADLTETCQENGWNVISMKNDFLTIYGDGVTKNADSTPFTDHLLEIASGE